MKTSLLSRICCPACGGPLDLHATEARGERVASGTLQCACSSSPYPIRNGIPFLVPDGKFEAPKAAEVEGWTELRRKSGAYEHPDLVTSFQLPYTGSGVWVHTARMFDLALQEMNLKGNELVLDMGAGQGWASRRFSERGCASIAIDIDADELYGLGRAWAIMEHAGVYFEPAIADGEHLPFFPDQFDIVFFSTALHHFEKTEHVLRQVYKVLKPGGRLVAAGEPAVPIFAKERDAQMALDEWHAGIVERRPKVFQYWWSLWRSGFRSIRIDTDETFHAAPSQLYSWIEVVKDNIHRAVRPRNKPLVKAVFGVVQRLPYRWARWMTLNINGGNLLLRAVKPGAAER